MKSKRMQQIDQLVDRSKEYKLEESIAILKNCPSVQFDQSVDLVIRSGVDSNKSDQQVRGMVLLPHGTGKKRVVLVFAKGAALKEALDSGADFAGHEELMEKIQKGWIGFDSVVVTPDLMRDVGKLGKILGPKGLMPTPKSGGVTNNVGAAVRDIKAGRVEFKTDKFGIISVSIGKLSFSQDWLVSNIKFYISAVEKSKPQSVKGKFFLSVHLSSTMGPGLKIDLSEFSEKRL